MLLTCLGTKGSLLKFFPRAEQMHLLSQLRKCIRYLHKLIVRSRPGGNKYSEEKCAVSPGGTVLSQQGSIILYGKRERMWISMWDLSFCWASLVDISLPKSCQAACRPLPGAAACGSLLTFNSWPFLVAAASCCSPGPMVLLPWMATSTWPSFLS